MHHESLIIALIIDSRGVMDYQGLLIVQKHNGFPYFSKVAAFVDSEFLMTHQQFLMIALIIGPRRLVDDQSSLMLLCGWEYNGIAYFSRHARVPDPGCRMTNQTARVDYQRDYQRFLVCHQERSVRARGCFQTGCL